MADPSQPARGQGADRVIPTVTVTRYVTPLREGGSLPGLVEAEDLGIYVCKFRGAGQGTRVLAAEVIVGELARRLDIPTPRLVALHLDSAIARYEADEEVQDLLTASVGLNLGVDFLPGAFGYDGGAPDAVTAARVLWLDAFTANVDRTWRNPNLLLWHGRMWAIDHGAALYFHHSWDAGSAPGSAHGHSDRFARQAWDATRHVLLPYADGLGAADAAAADLLDETVLREVVEAVPADWLDPDARQAEETRTAYVAFLAARLTTRAWLPGGAAA